MWCKGERARKEWGIERGGEGKRRKMEGERKLSMRVVNIGVLFISFQVISEPMNVRKSQVV